MSTNRARNSRPWLWPVIIGGGNAGLCAAITAAEAGASVLILESAPRALRGGNSRHTRNLRAMHNEPNDVLIEAYQEDEYWDDLLRVTAGNTDEALARMTIRASSGVFGWMRDCGVRFQPSLTGTLNLGRTNAFFLGGGKALVNAYYLTAERLGVDAVGGRRKRVLRINTGGSTGISSVAAARRLLRYSVAYLPLLFALMAADKVAS